MKKLLLLSLCISFADLVYCQNTSNGYSFPATGTIRAFIVFAEIDYSPQCPLNTSTTDPTDYYTDPGGWEQWPSDAISTLPPTWISDPNERLFDYEFTTASEIKGKVTKLLYQSSFGKLIFLADYYPRVINVPCSFATSNGMSVHESVDAVLENLDNILGTINYPSNTANELLFTDFDNYDLRTASYPTNEFYGFTKIDNPDSFFDLVIVIWRNNRFVNGLNAKCDQGFGVHWSGSHSQIFDDLDGYNAESSFNACSASGAFAVTMAEMCHAFYGGNNWHTAGGAGKKTFLKPTRSLALSGQAGRIRACAYDRWIMDWRNDVVSNWPANYPLNSAKQNLISAINPSDNVEIPTENLQQTTVVQDYILRDFWITGDALRIKLPYLEGGPKNQYLWIENHQLTDDFDKNPFYSDECTDDGTKGLYTYVQVGKDQKEGNNLYSGSDTDPNSLSDWLMPITAEGNFDFKLGNLTNSNCISTGYPTYTILMDESEPNPFTGFSDLYSFFDTEPSSEADDFLWVYNADLDGNGSNECHGDCLQAEHTKIQNGVTSQNLFSYGDSKDAFNFFNGKTKISNATNPPTTSVLSYTFDIDVADEDDQGYDNVLYPNAPPDYENRKIHLNGLSVEILQENVYDSQTSDLGGRGAVKVRVKWNDYDIVNNTRWCGDIVLHPSITLSLPLNQASDYSLNIKPGYSITLDRGKTPTQHVLNTDLGTDLNGVNYFSQPTIMTCEANSYFNLENNSDLYIRNGSTLIMTALSKLEVKSGAVIHIETGSKLIIEDNAQLQIWQGALVHVEEGGELIINNNTTGKGVTFDPVGVPTSKLLIEGTLTYGNGADMVHEGYGYFHFKGTPTLNLGTGSNVNLIGHFKNDKILELEAKISIDGRDFTIKDGTVTIHNHAWFKVSNGKPDIANAKFTGVDAPALDNKGIYLDPVKPVFTIQSTDFAGLETGIEMNSNTVNTKVPIALTELNFTNCKVPVKCDHLNNRMTMTDCMATESGTTGSVGIALSNTTKIITLNNTSFNFFEKGAAITNATAFYLDNGSKINNCSVGIYGNNAKVWLRNGAAIDLANINAVELYGNWNSTSGAYTSLLTMGDIGCGNITRCIGNCISGKNFVLNIDAYLHDENNENDNVYNPNWIYAEPGVGNLFSVCYDVGTYPSLLMQKNIWAPSGSSGNTNPSIPASSFKRNNGCLLNYSGVDYDPISSCGVVPSLSCIECFDSPKMDDEGDATTEITVATIVEEEYRDANEEFLLEDNDTTRDQFSTLAALDLNYDTLTSSWTVTTVTGIDLPGDDSSALRIMVAKILAEDTVNNERLTVFGLPVEDIFAPYYYQLLNPGQITEHDNVEPSYLFIHPNPASNKLTIANTNNEIKGISILNFMGRELYHQAIASTTFIDAAEFIPGIYLVKGLKSDGTTLEIQKLVIQ